MKIHMNKSTEYNFYTFLIIAFMVSIVVIAIAVVF